MPTPPRLPLVTCLALLLLTGCGGGSPFDYVPVTGSIHYEDGSLIDAHEIRVTFVPQIPPKDRKTHARQGTGEVDVTDGTLQSVTSHKFNDGIAPGRHKVLVEAFTADLDISDAVPRIYADLATTPLEVDTYESTQLDLSIQKPEESTP